MSKQLYTVSKEGLDYLCGLINKIVSTPSELISDITLSTNKTMSSVKIDKIIKQCLQDANEYSNEVVNSLTHLMAEKIDFEPTLDNTTDKINTLLLYSANSDNNYTQYLRLTNELLNLGDTGLSLNEYIKEVDADTKYTLKTTTDTLTAEVNNIKSDFTTHKDDTDIHTSADEKASYVKKTSITTTINSTSTHTQVPSAKSVYDNTLMLELPEVNSGYNIDITRKYIMTHVNPTENGDHGTYPTEVKWGALIQLPVGNYRSQILISMQGMYYRIMKSGIWQPWYKVNATEVRDTTTYPKETT